MTTLTSSTAASLAKGKNRNIILCDLDQTEEVSADRLVTIATFMQESTNMLSAWVPSWERVSMADETTQGAPKLPIGKLL